jgi:hypothetical protein
MSYEPIFDALRETRFPLNHGTGAIPAVGFGTLFRDLSVTTQAIKQALETGFRHFDCAERYRNEEMVGVAIKDFLDTGEARREDLFITTKLWNTQSSSWPLPRWGMACNRTCWRTPRLPGSPDIYKEPRPRLHWLGLFNGAWLS